MKMNKPFHIFFVTSLILGISLLCYGENAPLFSVRVESLEREKILLDFPAKPGDRFYIHYIHSSDKTPVHDIFEIGISGEMILIEENFDWYGAGLEFMNWEKASINIEDGKIKVLFRRHFPSLLLRVGRVANHTFIFNGVNVPLREIARGGELLKIWVGPRNR
ncbi:MAG: DUF1850 domain-containing protein [Thermodesulfobacteriota bacterium]|nr:DUF1850 domain-containing protein [Thermodesulfobacteriota bacterium]